MKCFTLGFEILKNRNFLKFKNFANLKFKNLKSFKFWKFKILKSFKFKKFEKIWNLKDFIVATVSKWNPCNWKSTTIMNPLSHNSTLVAHRTTLSLPMSAVSQSKSPTSLLRSSVPHSTLSRNPLPPWHSTWQLHFPFQCFMY